MNICEYENFELKITQEAFLIKPIRELYNADRTKTKDKFMSQMAILYFYIDPRSSYSYITDDATRLETILLEEGLPKDFKIDPKLALAMETYRKHVMTTSSLLLQDTKLAIDKLREFLRTVDLNATDDKGKPLYTINNITSAIKQIPQLSKDLMEAEKAVAKDIEEAGRARGGNERKKLFEDGIPI